MGMAWGWMLVVLALAAAALAQAERPEVPRHADPVIQGVQEHLNRLCAAHDARLAAVRGEAQLLAEIERARRRFLGLLDLDPERPRKPPAARPVETLDFPAYRIEKVVLEVEKGVPVPCTVYVPKEGPERKPALLVPHGHSGRDRPVYQNGYQRLAKAGFLVLAKDGWGKQERRGTGHGGEGGQLFLTGTSLMSLELWDNIRCVDYLLSRPDVDGERLGMVGLSGGGSQTLFTAAIEPRIRAASPTCAVTTFQADLADTTMCVCELLADILTVGDHGLFLAMAYPRPLLVVNGTRDAIFPIAGARAAVRQARALYAAGGHEERVRLAEFDAPHDWNDAMLDLQAAWFREQLRLPARPAPPPGDGPLPYTRLRCLPDGDLPPGSRTLSEVNRARIPAAPGRPLAEDAAWLAAAIRGRWSGAPAQPAEARREDAAPDPSRLFTREQLSWASGLGGRVSAAVTRPLEPPAGPPRVVVRLERDRQAPRIERLYWEDRIRTHAVVVDLAYTGKGLAPAQEAQAAAALVSSGRSLLAERTRDLLVTLEVLSSHGLLPEDARLTLAGHGFDGVLLLAAAGLLPERASLVLDRVPVTYLTGAELDFRTPASPEPPAHWTILPGLARRGDLSALLEVAAPRRVLLAHPLDAAQEALDREGLERLLRPLRRTDRRHLELLPREADRRQVMGRLNRLVTGD